MKKHRLLLLAVSLAVGAAAHASTMNPGFPMPAGSPDKPEREEPSKNPELPGKGPDPAAKKKKHSDGKEVYPGSQTQGETR